MAPHSRAKKQDQFGKGKVTPVQIAYIVDQYLSENHFAETRSLFRSEASALISKTPVQEAPKGLMSLETIIEEYVSMKEQKLVVEVERKRLEEEHLRVQTLLQGMQNVMNVYNSSGQVVASAQVSENAPPSGQIVTVSQPWGISNMSKPAASFMTPMLDNPSKKRQSSNLPSSAPSTKKSRSRKPNKSIADGSIQSGIQQQSIIQSSIHDCVDRSVQGSSVAKVLFHKTTTTSNSVAQNSSSPITPPCAPSTQSGKNSSPVGHSSSTNTSDKAPPPDFSSNCITVSTKTVIISPYKKETYHTVENHCSSTCSLAKSGFEKMIRRDKVKGRLNFDGVNEMTSIEKSTADESSTSETDDTNIFDLDMPNLDFNISDLLLDFDMHCKEVNNACHQSELNPSSVETVSSGDKTLPETSSATTAQVFSSTSDSCNAMKLVLKSIITSPAKSSSPIKEY